MKSPITLGQHQHATATGGHGSVSVSIPRVFPFSSTSILNLPHHLPPDRAVAELNRHIGFAHNWGGKPTYFFIDADGRVQPRSREELRCQSANRFVHEAGKNRELFKVWDTSPDRYEVAEVRFDPTGRQVNQRGESVLNLWRGFTRKARKGSCRRMLWHLREVVCSGSREHFRYLLVWMAHAIQRPYEAPGVVVVLRSKIEGTGKTTVCNWLTDMFGGHALMLNTSDQLLGKFNAHLETLSLIVVNEPSWAGNRDDAAKLKSMITDPTLVIERKHGGVYQIPNILHFMFTTNAEWAIPAGAGARRFFLLDVATTKVGDRSYFEALYAEADNGGVEALMYILQRVRLDHFNPRAVPITDALREQQERSLSLEADWGLDLADRGCSQARGLGPSGTIAFGQPVDVRALYDDYVAYAASRRARAMSTEVFGKWLAKVGLDRHRTRTKRQRILLPPDEFAALIRKDAGIHS